MQRGLTIGVTLSIVLSTVLGAAGPMVAQEIDQRAAARELARMMFQDSLDRRFEDQVAATMIRSMGAALQQRLGRDLLEVEWQMLTRIIRTFAREALPSSRIEELAADIYVRHFDATELRDLLAFQRSALGRKTARLTPLIVSETILAIDNEIRTSDRMPAVLDELRRAFPVLAPESP